MSIAHSYTKRPIKTDLHFVLILKWSLLAQPFFVMIEFVALNITVQY